MAKEWAVRFPDGTIESAGLLGENRARMLAARFGGEAFEWNEACPEGDPGCDAPDDGEWHCHDACELGGGAR